MKRETAPGSYFGQHARDYDRLQPLRIEMYELYHDLALDFVPFDNNAEFRMLDLGCGTGTFLNAILERYPKAQCVALDYSPEMLDVARQKTAAHAERVALHQRDLNRGLPEGLGSFELVSAFSALHHLTDENKLRLLGQICDVLVPGGWLFLIDAMSVHFNDDVFSLGRARSRRRLEERFAQAGIDIHELDTLEEEKRMLGDDAPDRDRIAPLSAHLDWLSQAGFRSVDHVWHFWMEHFIIARK